jgi:hypothetical protein
MDAIAFDTIPENNKNMFVSMIDYFVRNTITSRELFVVCFSVIYLISNPIADSCTECLIEKKNFQISTSFFDQFFELQ